MSDTALIDVEGLSIAFTDEDDGAAVPVAEDISFSIAPGKTLGLVGESGCGKSVTALSLMRLLPPSGRITGGRIRFDGRETLSLPEAGAAGMEGLRGRHMAMIFQDPGSALNPVATVGDQIAEVFEIHYHLARDVARQSAVKMLDRVGIPDPELRARSYPHQLSGGMKQRVMIAMALACRPSLLIADEPTTALDVTVQSQILDLVVELQNEMDMAVLFISHNLAVVAQVADEVAVMYAGRIVERAPAHDLFAMPRHPYTQALIATLPRLGHPQQRFPAIPGTVPDARVRGKGCGFAERCPLADATCRETEPALTADAEGRAVACFKPLETSTLS